MKVRNLIAGGCLLATVFTACKKDDDNSLNSTDKNFLVQAAFSNNNEIDAGQLASTKGTKDSVKMYGSMMVSDHTTANTELHTVADPNGVQLPTTPDPAHVVIKQQLMAMTAGTMFDTAYIRGQVRDHNATIALFQDEIANGKNQAVKDLASKKLPVITAHQQLATTISNRFPK